MSSSVIDEGWAALRDGDPQAARRLFEDALAEAESGAALEGLATVLYLEHDYSGSLPHYERAFAAYREAGDIMSAGRAAWTAAWVNGGVLGNWAVQNGWVSRARTVLESAGKEGPEYGWALIMSYMMDPDTVAGERLLREAVSVGRRLKDPDIEFEALAHLAGIMIITDRTEEGMALFDEALAAACAGEVTDLSTLGSIFCVFFWACERVNDVSRAEQWMRAAKDIMARRNAIAAHCRAHYGGILTVAGRWNEAELELMAAASHFDRGITGRRAVVMIRLADLRVRQGRLEEAALLLEGLDHHPDAVRTLATLHHARGQTALARDLLERTTEGRDDDAPPVGESTMLGPLLALLVDVYLDDGRIDDAARAAARLRRLANSQRGPYLRAAAAFADGRVQRAGGGADPRALLHEALEGFAQAQMPMEMARARLEMAEALADGSPEVAVAEAKAALEIFQRLEAARHADAAGALLRSLGAPIRTGAKGVGDLTRREAEVLQLVGSGLSNAEIGDRLFIARKTVEHHVGRVLAKLGLRNRAEAAAFVAREKISP